MDPTYEPVIVGFLCNWCSYRAADLAGTARLHYAPNMRHIRVMCSGRVEPDMVLKALSEGADGVLIAGCHPGECHYIDGNLKTLRRYVLLRRMLRQFGIEEQRVQLVWASASEGPLLAQTVDRMTAELRLLGPLRWRQQVIGNGHKPEAAAPPAPRVLLAAEDGVTMPGNGKPKFAMYWAASCGGCEIAVLNIGDKILEVDAAFDIVFWPVAADFKYEDVRGYPDGYIDLCLFNGAIRNAENEEIAHLLRRKSKLLVAFGSCAYEGCIPALGNLTTREAIFRAAYLTSPSTDNPSGLLPQPATRMPEGELHLPDFYPMVKALDQVVAVDYVIPGCPPESRQIWAVLQVVINALQSGADLPPRGTILGAGEMAVCQECSLEKREKKIQRFYRPYEIIPQPGLCLLEQGLVCMGPATRNGCGALCPQVGMGCRGCYGPLDGVEDQGARMLAAIASVIGVGAPGEEEDEIARKLEAVVETLADPAGTFYRFSLAHSFLKRAKANGGTEPQGGAA